MQFDWYQATIPGGSPRALVDGLMGLEPGAVLVEGRGRYGYQVTASVVLTGGEKLAEVWYGGPNGAPHVASTSAAAQVVAPWLREQFPDHAVTRADVCEDFQRPGVFEDLAAKLFGIADERGIKVQHFGDWYRAQDGRTLKLGGRTSGVIARLYEKGIELRSRVPDLYQGAMREVFPDDLVRLELQVRPRDQARQRAAVMQPAEFWGFGAWAAALWEQVAGEPVRREAVDKGYRPADIQRAYGWMLNGYWRVLEAMALDLGDWACVGKQIGHDIGVIRSSRAEMQRIKGEQS